MTQQTSVLASTSLTPKRIKSKRELVTTSSWKARWKKIKRKKRRREARSPRQPRAQKPKEKPHKPKEKSQQRVNQPPRVTSRAGREISLTRRAKKIRSDYIRAAQTD